MQNRSVIFSAFVITLLFCLIDNPAFAHRINVFSVVEGDEIVTSVFFSDGSKCKKCPVEISDMNGAVAVKEFTDELGEHKYKTQKPQSYKIVIQTPLGHRAETTVEKSEFENATNEDIQEPTKNIVAPKNRSNLKNKNAGQDIATLVKQEVNEQLKTQLSKKNMKENQIDKRDIVSGLGFILGLFALLLHFTKRKEQ